MVAVSHRHCDFVLQLQGKTGATDSKLLQISGLSSGISVVCSTSSSFHQRKRRASRSGRTHEPDETHPQYQPELCVPVSQKNPDQLVCRYHSLRRYLGIGWHSQYDADLAWFTQVYHRMVGKVPDAAISSVDVLELAHVSFSSRSVATGVLILE